MGKSLQTFYQQKVVVISGAASGIGRALALCFAGLGAELALCDFDEDNLKDTVHQIKDNHPNCRIHTDVFDVADEQAWSAFLAQSSESLGHLDMIINNAGIEGSTRPAWATDMCTLKRVMDVNFYGMVNGSRLGLPYLVDRPWSALVNVSSIFGLLGVPNAGDYCASKFAIRGYTESLRAELYSVYPDLQVHLVHPGGINTHITRHPNSQAFKQKYLKTRPEALALQIAKGVMHNTPRIVYGNQSALTHWATKLLPLSWLSALSSKQMLSLNILDDYQPNHPGFKTRIKLEKEKE